jgi:hypothetical protein
LPLQPGRPTRLQPFLRGEDNNKLKGKPLAACKATDLCIRDLVSPHKFTLFEADLVIELLLRHQHDSLGKILL